MEILSNIAVIWFVAGAVLLLLEFVIPGVFILFFGIGAWLTALCVYLFEPSLGIQFLIFSTTSILSLVLLRSVILKRMYANNTGDDPDEEFIGGIGECIVDIRPEADGKVEFKGTSWTASSNTKICIGDKIKVINKVGLLLEVEPA